MKQHGPVYVLTYTIVFACVFGLVLSGVAQLTEERIRQNQEAKLKRQILMAFGYDIDESAASKEVLEMFDASVVEKELKDPGKGTVYQLWKGYSEAGFNDPEKRTDHKGQVIGYAFQVGGTGFWGPIEGILALQPDLKTILGITFYKDEETPGLGHEINKPWFRESFKGKTYRDAEGTIGFVFTTREEKAQNEVAAITGATETVKSVQSFLTRSIETFLRIVEAYDLGKGERL